MAKVSATWGSPWSGHILGLWLLRQDKSPEHTTRNRGTTYRIFRETSDFKYSVPCSPEMQWNAEPSNM